MTTRTVQYDSIDTLSCLGYSEREATFLYVVALYSGYFLRRQFSFAVKRHRGSAAAGFLAKAKRAGHVREIQCEPGRLLYQLYAKRLYQLVGQNDSQNRRAKSSTEIRRRLIMLDYVLSHLEKEEFLDSEVSRQKFFAQFGVKADAIASAKQFGESLPISVRRPDGNLTVRFPFIDEGQRSAAKFERFLSTHDKLLCSLAEFRGGLRRDYPGAISSGPASVQTSLSRNASHKLENPIADWRPIIGSVPTCRPGDGANRGNLPIFSKLGPGP